MDEKTRKAALEKVDYITPHIAYPDEFLDDKKLIDYFEPLEVDSNSYLKSKINIRIFDTIRGLEEYRKPVNKSDWTTHGNSAIVNAFYNPSENSIRKFCSINFKLILFSLILIMIFLKLLEFPAGILQGAFFNNDRPKYMNYGSIGFVMGHEVTHGFDDQGRQYDKDGNLREWWEPETKKKYLEKAQCIIDQ